MEIASKPVRLTVEVRSYLAEKVHWYRGSSLLSSLDSSLSLGEIFG